MTFEELQRSLSESSPPEDLSPLLRALWHDAKGEWDAAHRIAQDLSGPDAAWVHAYLHREEGDLWNAGYWYAQAGRPRAQGPLAEEWAHIAQALLNSVRRPA